jgi:hypothetical protein
MRAIRDAIVETQGDVEQTCERVIQWLDTLSLEEARAAFDELNQGTPDTPPTAEIQAIVNDADARSRGDEDKMEAIFRERLDSRENPGFVADIRADTNRHLFRPLIRLVLAEIGRQETKDDEEGERP